MLSNDLIHRICPSAVTVGEDVLRELQFSVMCCRLVHQILRLVSMGRMSVECQHCAYQWSMEASVRGPRMQAVAGDTLRD